MDHGEGEGEQVVGGGGYGDEVSVEEDCVQDGLYYCFDAGGVGEDLEGVGRWAGPWLHGDMEDLLVSVGEWYAKTGVVMGW